MVEFTRRRLMETSVAAALGASVAGPASGARTDDEDTRGAPTVKGDLKRFSSTAFGAEVTGPFVFDDGTPLYSLQHPSEENPAPYARSGIGYFEGFRFAMGGTNDDFAALSPPQTEAERGRVRGAAGDYVFLARGADPIDVDEHGDATQRLGVAQTPDGTDVTRENFAGTMYGDAAQNPDCNQFVPTAPDGSAGYLFTNWENSPGNVSRIPISRDGDGGWTADLENATNLANTDAFRELGGTRINCYGDLSPWGTMLSAEENYAHARLAGTAAASDVVAAGTGRGRRGAHAFWNRPNPSSVQSAVDDYYGDDAWTVQGYWALTGVEFLAYYLGADPVDQSDGENTTTPIGDGYPNPYRYGYFVDVREPTADDPEPVKYYVMGRAAWEAPDVQRDARTVYGCSDGAAKSIYKFVADRPIHSYGDPMDVAGTLYAARVTNDAAARDRSPADVSLELAWVELGSATNREVAGWIAEYDDVTQVDYLDAHADWEEGDEVTPAVLEEADRTVVEDGNRSYVRDSEIVEWAAQYEERGPDGVDEALRRVPFLETRAAAREVGATVEFNKAEGVDSAPNAGPGDAVYFALSSLSGAATDDAGDLQLDRVDGGVVYRAELGPDYDVTTLEPVIVGPDGSDPADVADDALVNVDNVYVMDDGRVLCCEDADQFGRSYSNDCMYVYAPEESAGRGGGRSNASGGRNGVSDGENGDADGRNDDESRNDADGRNAVDESDADESD